MTSLALHSLVVNLVWVVAALALGRGVLWWFDRHLGISFLGWYSRASDHDRALYFAARLLAVAYIVGTVIRPPL